MDSNNVTVGPNEYLNGARVCNIGGETAQNIRIRFVREGAYNNYLTIKNSFNSDTWYVPTLPSGIRPNNHHQITARPNNCFDAYYIVNVDRNAAAYNTVQRYRIEAVGDNTGYVDTNSYPDPYSGTLNAYDTGHTRQLYVEKILSQGRNEVVSFTNIAGTSGSGVDTPTKENSSYILYAGSTYEFELATKTATGYPQLTISSNFPNLAFQLVDVKTDYETPGGLSSNMSNPDNTSIYANACGFISNPNTTGYHESSSNCEFTQVPDQYPASAGKVGNAVKTRYKIKILGGRGVFQIYHLILDFSGGSYHYNADYGAGLDTFDVRDPVPVDLSIDKSHTGNFSTGDNIYTLLVKNNSTTDVAKAPITVTDTLPAGISFVSTDTGTTTGWTCSAANQDIVCTNPNNLASGATSTIKLKVNVSTSVATNVVNTATASSNTPDPDLTNNTDSDPTTVLKGVNVSLTKTHSPATFLAGSTGIYTLTASNSSGFNADAPLIINDTLPTGLTFATTSGSSETGSDAGWGCTADGQNITCTNSSGLNTGSTSKVLFKVNVEPNVPLPSVTNIASLSTGSLDTNPSDNTNIQDVTPTAVPAPDLAITKTDNDFSFTTNVNGTYTLTVKNVGTIATTGTITVVDTLPTSFTYVPPIAPATNNAPGSSGWTCTESPIDTITCTNPGPLLPTQSSSIILKVTPTTATGSPFTNTATVSTPGDVYNAASPGNNLSSDTTPVGAGTKDIIVNKTISGTPPTKPGDSISYNITVTNNINAGNDQEEIKFTDQVPTDITNVKYSCVVTGTGNGGGINDCDTTSATDLTNVTPPGNLIQLNNLSLKKGGGQVTITVTGTVSNSFLGVLPNTATAFPLSGFDTNPVDNSSTATATINGTDLTISKTHSDPLTQNIDGTYTITVKNVSNTTIAPGRATTNPITVIEKLSKDFTFVSATSVAPSTGWYCAVSDDAATTNITEISCVNPNSIAAGASSSFQINVKPTKTGAYTNTTTNQLNSRNEVIVSTSGDGLTANNTAYDPTNVNAPNFDLTISKSAIGTFSLGATAKYGLTVSASGTSAAPGPITVNDTLPVGLNFLSGSGSGWSCSATPVSGQDKVTCVRNSNLTAGSSSAITLNVLVGSTTAASISNTARVEVVTGETNVNNNESTITTSVGQNADLSIVKTLSGNLVVGSNATYNLKVVNNGPSNASTVTVTDNLPNGLTFQSFADNSVWTCTNTATSGTCAAGATQLQFQKSSLTIGASETIALNVAVSSSISLPATISNTATVSSTTPDSDNTNNSSTTSTSLAAKTIDLILDKSHFGSFAVGGKGTYTLEVKNQGNSTATGTITIRDPETGTLPNNISLSSFVGQGWTCGGTSVITCTNPNTNGLAPGATTAVDIIVNVGTGTSVGSFTNTAIVSIPSGETNTNNNSASDPTTIVGSADISVTKAHVGTFSPGQQGTYTIVVTNSAASIATPTSITLIDQLPNYLTYVSGTGTNWDCPATVPPGTDPGLDVTCTYNASLAPNNSTTLTFKVLINTSVPNSSSLTNFVTVYSSTPDPDTSNNTAKDTVTVVAGGAIPPKLRLVKRITAVNNVSFTDMVTVPNQDDSLSKNPALKWPDNYLHGKLLVDKQYMDNGNNKYIMPNDQVEYTIYFISDGGNTAKNVSICDLVPANQTFASNSFNSLADKASGGLANQDRGIAASISSSSSAAHVLQSYTNVADTDTAQYYAPNLSVPTSCSAENTNGAIVIKLGDIPQATAQGTPLNSYGFVRFRAKVN
ncbi:conserved repeat domain protein [Crinalium epipsammum PCC 9333]|uniref:Conserved repeat domain protein n=1 Tax=Crinalium epipsammum PCC 9333 TaxID=1173022 RepID=K9VVJ4_9CYAN|nr:DUF11 domain-containing protein [Crinalium epipsammum]AFZ11996.1 conserved repeat domain protein [Crinalium epipsammum PCC 9333]